MAEAELIVHRLRLAVPPVGAPGLAARIDDALRCSTKPPLLHHRHVLVRRLRLRLPAAATAAGIALQLAQAWQRIAALARPLDAATEADDAVWATDEAAARAALVLRWARGAPVDAWFWQRIGRPAGAAADAWPMRALRLAAAPPDPASGAPAAASPGHAAAAPALRTVLQALAGAGLLPRFIAGLPQADLRQLAALLADQAPPAVTSAPAAAAGPSSALPRGALAAAWQAVQARLAEAPADAAGALRPAAVPTRSDGPVTPRRASATDLWPATAAAAGRSAGPAIPAPPPARRADAVAALAMPAPAGVDAGAPATAPDGVVSDWAGLWLLLPILLRCGLAAADAPGPAFAQALRAAAGRLHLPADDPVHRIVDGLDLPLRPVPGPWLHQARLAALRDARLPLRRIARRRGQVLLSDSRLDVVFPPEAADVGIRRAGFDLDPGFVPWLGRIVRFHYLVP